MLRNFTFSPCSPEQVQQSRLQQVIRIGYRDPHCSAKISEILTPILAEHPDLSPLALCWIRRTAI